jgi:hypothetical protein
VVRVEEGKEGEGRRRRDEEGEGGPSDISLARGRGRRDEGGEGRGREGIALVGFKKNLSNVLYGLHVSPAAVQNIFRFALPLWETTDERCLNLFCLGAPTTSPSMRR